MGYLTLLLTITSLASWVSGLVVDSTGGLMAEAPIAGYNIEELEWEIQYKPDQPAVLLNGTVEKVHAQLLELNPNYEVDMAEIIANHAKAREVSYSTYRAPIPDPEKGDHTVCGKFSQASVDGSYTDRLGLRERISYLRGVPGRPTRGPGPGSCGQVSCAYADAIWWCNYNANGFTLNSFDDIANAAQVVVDDCLFHFNGAWWASGQRFHANKWSAIVSNDRCGQV